MELLKNTVETQKVVMCIEDKIDEVINHISERIKTDGICDYETSCMVQALAELITARSSLIDKSSFKTCELVEELKKREGVEEITVEPYAIKQIEVDGPAVILKVID